MKRADFFIYWGWRAGSWLAQRVPLAVAYAVSVAFADVAYLAWRRRREIAKENFSAVLGKPAEGLAVARTARQSFREYAKYIVEIMRLPRFTTQELRDSIEVQGEQHLDAALAKGRGVIFVSAHFGNFEFGGVRIAQPDRPLNVVADDIRMRRLFELLIGNRKERSVTLMPPEGAARKVLEALRRNELVGFMMDLGPRAEAFDNVRVRFFGKDTQFPAVAANLARASGAPIVVGCVVRRRGQRFLGIVNEPIVLERTSRALEDVQRATQKIVADLERFIGSWPEQWYMFRPMWPREDAASA